MLKMKSATLDLQRAVADLAEFDQLLMCRDEHEEKCLQEFFSARPDLLLLMPAIFMPEQTPAAYLSQCSILHEFRADYALANAEQSQFLFIEFEHAKKNSIFSTKAPVAKQV